MFLRMICLQYPMCGSRPGPVSQPLGTARSAVCKYGYAVGIRCIGCQLGPRTAGAAVVRRQGHILQHHTLATLACTCM